jgi:hypothetical protein
MLFTHLKEKIEKKYFSSHKLPKQQSTSFWSQGILGVKMGLKYGTLEVVLKINKNKMLNKSTISFWQD